MYQGLHCLNAPSSHPNPPVFPFFSTQTAEYSYRAAVRELVPQLCYLDNLRLEETEHHSSSTMGEDLVILQTAIKDSKSPRAAVERGLFLKHGLGFFHAHLVILRCSFLSLQKKPQRFFVLEAECCQLIILSALPLFAPTIQLIPDPPQAPDPGQPSGLDLYLPLDQNLVLQSYVIKLLQERLASWHMVRHCSDYFQTSHINAAKNLNSNLSLLLLVFHN